MREGAYDFLAKPYPAERLIATIGHAAEKRRLVLETAAWEAARLGADAEPFIGNTPAMLRIKQTLRHIADADVDVLVEGETGTGKEVVASALSYEPPTPARTGGDQLRRAARKRDRERAVRP